jgi:hypothetical protein
MAHNKESATVWNLKPEWWGAPLGEMKPVTDDYDDDDNDNISSSVCPSQPWSSKEMFSDH